MYQYGSRQKDGNLKHIRVDMINWTTQDPDEKRLIQNFWSNKSKSNR